MIIYIVAVIIIFLGIGIKYFKWDFLIAGYNMMSKEQKKDVDKEGLRRSVGNFSLLLGGILIISGVSHELGYKLLSFATMMMIFPLTIIQVMSSQKYDHSRDRKARKIETRFIIGFTIFIMILVSSSLIYGSREPKIQVMSDRIVIGGIYGRTIKKENIEKVTLEDNIPKVLNKTNGFDLGYILRGNFTLEGIGNSSIYIHENSSPYIVIKTEKMYYIINYRNPEKTKELFNEIIK